MVTETEERLNLICLWCGKPTSGDRKIDGVEHIFPKAIGGKKTLPVGSVCKKCNHELGNLDRFLKKEHPAMMDAFQVDPRIKGYKRGRKDKKRKKKEKILLEGEGEAKHTRISRKKRPNVEFLNVSFIVTSETFVRALHKCIVNVLCDKYGSITTRKKYGDLLKFVKDGGDVRPWSYAISFPSPFERPLISEPKCFVFSGNGENKNIISFIHTSGIWVTGSHPCLLNPKVIEAVSELITKEITRIKEPNTKKSITDFFGFDWSLSKDRVAIGKLKFFWTVEGIEGKPSDEFLYLLTKCKLCGQTNPTGIHLPRKIIYNGNVNNVIKYKRNTWNHYTLEDLRKLGLKVAKWDKKNLESYMTQGLSIPIENDVKKLEICNCKTTCINCGGVINYSASDCFL